MEKNRLEAFSDGILAIIITILVLELKQPAGKNLKDLLALGTLLLTYLLSFVFIAIYWVNHHHVFHAAAQVNVKILWCNIAWLFAMSFIPFATAWVGTYPTARVPLALYFGDMSLACITFHWMYYLICKDSFPDRKFKLGVRSVASLIVYFVAAVVGGFCPIAAFVAVAAVSLWWIVPIKEKVAEKDAQ